AHPLLPASQPDHRPAGSARFRPDDRETAPPEAQRTPTAACRPQTGDSVVAPLGCPAAGQPRTPGCGVAHSVRVGVRAVSGIPPAFSPPSGKPSMSLLQSTTQSGKVALDRIRDMPDRAVCAFDFDGTLAPIVPDPRDSRAHSGAVPALRALAGRVRAVAVITGPPAQTAVDYGGLDAVPGITVLGHYGRELWEDGKLTVPEPPPGVAMVREALPGLLDEVGAPEGTWIEDKKHALAVHTRRTADPEAALELLRAPLADLAKRAELAVEPGRMVI